MQSFRQLLWNTVTGEQSIDYIEQDGKIYISVDSIVSAVVHFRLRLLRLGIANLVGLKPDAILELFQHLINHFKFLNKLKAPIVKPTQEVIT